MHWLATTAVDLESHGCKAPRVIVRVVHVQQLHQNFLIFVCAIPRLCDNGPCKPIKDQTWASMGKRWRKMSLFCDLGH